jgi:hypothetical protein
MAQLEILTDATDLDEERVAISAVSVVSDFASAFSRAYVRAPFVIWRVALVV